MSVATASELGAGDDAVERHSRFKINPKSCYNRLC